MKTLVPKNLNQKSRRIRCATPQRGSAQVVKEPADGRVEGLIALKCPDCHICSTSASKFSGGSRSVDVLFLGGEHRSVLHLLSYYDQFVPHSLEANTVTGTRSGPTDCHRAEPGNRPLEAIEAEANLYGDGLGLDSIDILEIALVVSNNMASR